MPRAQVIAPADVETADLGLATIPRTGDTFTVTSSTKQGPSKTRIRSVLLTLTGF
mgnify:CR=1 FL=1